LWFGINEDPMPIILKWPLITQFSGMDFGGERVFYGADLMKK
jgi:hypothetical protein